MNTNVAVPSAPPSGLSSTITKQELNEVYLLLDFVSGRADRHLSEINGKIVDPADMTKTLNVSQVIGKVSSICYPSQGSTSNYAQDTSFLLLVKDQLNVMVYPARGLTIAYTILFTEGEKDCTTSRVQIAKDAFPILYNNAKRFRDWKNRISWAGLIITVLSALLLWQVTYGAQLAARFDEAKKSEVQSANKLYAELDRLSVDRIYDLSSVCRLPQKKSENNKEKDYDSNIVQLCNEYAYRRALFCVAIADIGSFTQTPTFAVFRWLLPTYGAQSPADCLDQARAEADVHSERAGATEMSTAGAVIDQPVRIGRQEDAQSVAGLLATMSNYILPILFGLVGTIAALVRGIQDKIRDSVLAPRDFALLLIRLPLGMMAGVCVGLFLNPTSVAAQTNGSVGAFTISASGIAFLAGYGAEGFFGALDMLIQRIFNFDQQPKSIGPRSSG